MSPVSRIPGRVRMESRELTINHHRWTEISRRINRIAGVISAEINCRTGRLLIRFDEARLDSDLLLRQVGEIIGTPEGATGGEPVRMTGEIAVGSGKKSLFSRLAMDIAGHALLPGPLGVLLPFALTALRKTPAHSPGI